MVALCFSKDVLSRFLYKIKIFNNWIKLIATTFNNLTLFHNYATYPYKNSLAESVLLFGKTTTLSVCRHMFQEYQVKACDAVANALKFNSGS